ncbi:MAG: B12-binding domain-containing radical SAM protein [Candidatus Aminicenantes bacterium]|nr:MAG: B12-binding domain-containing radical SAM protein [Candidatus Aminicenantes bacterium]
MKITFINPRAAQLNTRDLDAVPQEIKELMENNPKLRQRIDFTRQSLGALGLLTIAALVPADIEIEFFDENMEQINYDRHFDLIALGGTIGQMTRALGICDITREKKIPTVVGGPAATVFHDMYTRKGVTVVRGEGEFLFKEFLKDFIKENPKPVYDNTTAPNHIDLKDSPIPRFDLAAKYPYTMVGVQVSRGCPYDCEFCQVTEVFGDKFRTKPIDNIITEIKAIKTYWPDRFFMFYDDNPFARRNHTMKLFDRLYHRENIDLGHWGASITVDLYKDPELLELLTKKGGINHAAVGFESLSEKNLASLGNKMKTNYLDKYREAIAAYKEYNVNILGCFIYGFENNQPQDLQDIVDFLLENEIDGVLGNLTPLPGTRLYNRLKNEYEDKYGKIRKSSLAAWGKIRKFLYEKSGTTEEEVQKQLIHAYSIVYADENYHNDVITPLYFLL